ncbi:MAG TPA: RHS repeat-associated core domain-containing protein [Candidatus Kapabacteria bacterium]|nr:RHS repeat-associated core domain-containing protein [Candidatus Kapabacteria bacterium]
MAKIQLYIIKSKLGDHTSTSLSASAVRKYDYEIGRFTSVDPLWEKYTGWTGYQYSLNNPVNASDGNGMYFDYTETDYYFREKAKEYVNLAIDYLSQGGSNNIADKLIFMRDDPNIRIFMKVLDYKRVGIGGNEIKPLPTLPTIIWSPNSAFTTEDGLNQSPATALLHEAFHAFNYFYFNLELKKHMKEQSDCYLNVEEQNVTNEVNEVAEKLGEGVRVNDYWTGKYFYVNSPIQRK